MAKPPPQQSLAQQAGIYAQAAVPTIGSINSQYNQSQGDVHNFTGALIRLLQAPQTDPYGSAVQSQTTANNMAVHRLQNLGIDTQLGNPYAAGSAAAVGGMGDSALGSLNQQRGAAAAYQRQLPGIAAARGELANSSLITARHAALTDRAQQYSSAYMQALQQLRDYGLQRGQLQLSRQQLASQNAQANARLAEQSREFNINDRTRRQIAALDAATSGGSTTKKPKWTPTEQQNYLSRAGQGAQAAVKHGVSPRDYVYQATVINGIPAPFALLAVKRVYGRLNPKSPLGQEYLSWNRRKEWVLNAKKHPPGPPSNQRNPKPPGR